MVSVVDLNGKEIEKIELPNVFREPIREDLILRTFLAIKSHERQPYGPNKLSGLRTSAHYHGERHTRYTMMNVEMARHQRLHGKTVPFLHWQARIAPQTKGGRPAHPPLPEKDWYQKINEKERKKAIKSAIAATSIKDLVIKRGHKVENIKELPIIVEDKIEEISKTKEIVDFLKKIGLEEELERVKEKKVRAGKGKMRGRRYKKKIGILFVVMDDKKLLKAVKNLPGCEVVKVKDLSVKHLAPGGKPGRLTIFSKKAIEFLEKVK
ncbi:MAG: 50S ribosomal protein L4 [Candidatus Aenigmatarchaeota archaeon]|jgi:large subunit ribosomal protein L4e